MTTRIAFIPRDGLFCKDGRGWHTSASGRGHALDWPWPSTVLGAVRTAWGRAEEDRAGGVFTKNDWLDRTKDIGLGRTLVLRRPVNKPWTAAHRVWPVPADALCLEGHGDFYRLSPRPQPAGVGTLGRDDDDAREALLVASYDSPAKPLTPPRWWSETDLIAWMTGEPVSVRPKGEWLSPSRRVQAHVGILPETLSADEGILYSHDVVETLDGGGEWAVGVEAALPSDLVAKSATLGSDGRLAGIEVLPTAMFEAPSNLISSFRGGSRGLRLVAVTPVEFKRGWLPDGFDREGSTYAGQLPCLGCKLTLRAALVPRPIHISGWDMANRRPKETSRMVPSGAVYFFERADGGSFSESDARRLWLAALGQRTSEGFGRMIPGTWKP